MKNIHILPTENPSRLYLTTHEYIRDIRIIEDSNFELNKDNAVINIEIGDEVFQIRVTKTHQLKP
jgi:hypothetical protein